MSSDTLQAVSKHEKVSIFDSPGDVDLTTQVNFGAIGHVMNHHDKGIEELCLLLLGGFVSLWSEFFTEFP